MKVRVRARLRDSSGCRTDRKIHVHALAYACAPTTAPMCMSESYMYIAYACAPTMKFMYMRESHMYIAYACAPTTKFMYM